MPKAKMRALCLSSTFAIDVILLVSSVAFASDTKTIDGWPSLNLDGLLDGTFECRFYIRAAADARVSENCIACSTLSFVAATGCGENGTASSLNKNEIELVRCCRGYAKRNPLLRPHASACRRTSRVTCRAAEPRALAAASSSSLAQRRHGPQKIHPGLPQNQPRVAKVIDGRTFGRPDV